MASVKTASIVAHNKPQVNWKTNHNIAVYQSVLPGEQVAPMLRAWAKYAEDYRTQYESVIGEDYVLGPPWKAIGIGVRELLNGVTGRLDCGTLDTFIRDTLQEHGFQAD